MHANVFTLEIERVYQPDPERMCTALALLLGMKSTPLAVVAPIGIGRQEELPRKRRSRLGKGAA